MKTISFEGYSDDTVCTKISDGGSAMLDEHDVYALRHSGSPLSGKFEILSETEGRVFVDVLWWTGWGFSVMPDAEDEDGPAWPMRLEPGHKSYTFKLSIDVADDAVLIGPLPSHGEG